MALQTIQGGVWLPPPALGLAGLPAYANTAALTANTHKYAFIFNVPKTGSLHKLHFRYGSAITSGATTRMQAYFETVSAVNGDPTGTAYGGAVVGTSSIQPAANTWDTITLGTDATATAGDIVAGLISFQTFNASDSITFSTLSASSGVTVDFPYGDTFGASWAKNVNIQVFAVEYSDGTFAYIPSAPWSAVTNTAFASNTAGSDEYALSFQLPVPFRLIGAAAILARAGDVEWNVYSGTTVQTGFPITLDKDQVGNTSQRPQITYFPTGFTGAANTQYRVSLRPTTTTSVTLQVYTVNSAAVLDQTEGGQNFFLSTRVDQGAWNADTTTQRPAIYLLFDKFDDGVQTGGVKIAQGLSGGCVG